MMRQPRITPWRTHEELLDVHKLLYSNSTSDIQRGLQRVNTWRNRGKIPHSIDSTASFLSLITTTHSLPSHELRMLYTIAFIRFINGLVDWHQKQIAVSIKSIAEKIGLPEWFIDLRHAGTHDDLPGEKILRVAVNQALEWLEINYWIPTIQGYSDIRESVREIIALFRNTGTLDLRELEGIAGRETWAEIMFPVILDEHSNGMPYEITIDLLRELNVETQFLDCLTRKDDEKSFALRKKLSGTDFIPNNKVEKRAAVRTQSKWFEYPGEWKACSLGSLPNGSSDLDIIEIESSCIEENIYSRISIPDVDDDLAKESVEINQIGLSLNSQNLLL